MTTWKEMYDVAEELERAIQHEKCGPHPTLVGAIESLTHRAKSLDVRVTVDADELLKAAAFFYGSLGTQLSPEQAENQRTALMKRLSGIRIVAARMKREQS